eukprot:scaffold344_cov215-Prasinococcus_capsulatus_cf.AAC.3
MQEAEGRTQIVKIRVVAERRLEDVCGPHTAIPNAGQHVPVGQTSRWGMKYFHLGMNCGCSSSHCRSCLCNKEDFTVHMPL